MNPLIPTTQAVEQLREELLNIAKRNSACINRQLSATEYQAEVWPLANNAIEEIMSALADTLKIVGKEIISDDVPEMIKSSANHKTYKSWWLAYQNSLRQEQRQRLELVVEEMKAR